MSQGSVFAIVWLGIGVAALVVVFVVGGRWLSRSVLSRWTRAFESAATSLAETSESLKTPSGKPLGAVAEETYEHIREIRELAAEVAKENESFMIEYMPVVVKNQPTNRSDSSASHLTSPFGMNNRAARHKPSQGV